MFAQPPLVSSYMFLLSSDCWVLLDIVSDTTSSQSTTENSVMGWKAWLLAGFRHCTLHAVTLPGHISTVRKNWAMTLQNGVMACKPSIGMVHYVSELFHEWDWLGTQTWILGSSLSLDCQFWLVNSPQRWKTSDRLSAPSWHLTWLSILLLS